MKPCRKRFGRAIRYIFFEEKSKKDAAFLPLRVIVSNFALGIERLLELLAESDS